MAQEWLFSQDVSIPWVLMRVLALEGLGVCAKEVFSGNVEKIFTSMSSIEWPVLLISSLVLCCQHGSLFVVVSKLPSTRAIIFTRFSATWIYTLTSPSSVQFVYSTAVVLAVGISFASDAKFSIDNVRGTLPGYLALMLHAISASGLQYLHNNFTTKRGSTFAPTVLGASVICLVLYSTRELVVTVTPTPIVPLLSLTIIPLLSYTSLPTRKLSDTSSGSPEYFLASYTSTCLLTVVFGVLLFSQSPTLVDYLVGGLMLYGIFPRKSQPIDGIVPTPTSRVIRSYMKAIMENAESRKIFYFLMLNLSYMLVQMVYGIWTNSLGLISDAIHMGFDCMAIGVGLLASVMATWPPNEQFTYGYARIETLSGFANGIFLILISIFIIFEAIQRLLDPPPMNTNQLLLVSSLGLCVNLFGMFAMGGHHHGHGHDHSHDHGHDHRISHSDHKSQSHDHSHPHRHEQSDSGHFHHHDHDHDHGHEQDHDYEHSHSRSSIEDSSRSCIIEEHSADDYVHHSHHTKRHSRGSSLRIDADKSNLIGVDRPIMLARLSDAPDSILSPITPSYRFGHDEHFAAHHQSHHMPNLHDHSHTHAHPHEGHSHNMRGVFLHVMADTLGSVGVIVSTLLIQLYGWTGFDPIASLFIAVLIAASVIPLVIDTGKVLSLDVSNRDIDIQGALADLSSVEGLSSYSSPHFWPKDASSLIGSIHVQFSPPSFSSSGSYAHTKLDRVVERVDALLRSKVHGLDELTIQVDEAESRL
ncbi:zinc transporter [Heterobasidion irregulare TC 32-1]|uniref:Zinc transporter n=1 Tax=Heterobasidion irregulare (strain TC 32-1) TaxID=747525 RepID=W4JZE5_HETIT|nr:zinc transporter [Heterobasidion irregulare TC 32-1]ETW78917.1 zinc transporter [Heterobasidion irregulare TC 32-1]